MSKQTVYSGLYWHPDSTYDTSWTVRAIARQQRWCREIGADYMLMQDMSKWARYYRHPDAWTFGTLIKFLALEHFTQTYNKTFVWADLDVYPTELALHEPLPTDNLFYAPKTTTAWARKHNAWHMNNKLAWWKPAAGEYLAWSTGMFVMDRDTAFGVWDWLNKEHHINHRFWWEAYYDRQRSLDKHKPWEFGSEEAMLEEWLNSQDVQFECMSDSYHSVHPSMNPLFLHFYGQSKQNYPHEA